MKNWRLVMIRAAVASLSILILLLLSSCGGEESGKQEAAKPSEFELRGWQIIDDAGTAALQIEFTEAVDSPLEFTLIGPHGNVVDFSFPKRDASGAILHLADGGRTPIGGQYTLTVRERFQGGLIATEYLNFEGARATITRIEPAWDYWAAGHYSLQRMPFVVRNDGDLPLYIFGGTLTFNGEIYLLGPSSSPLLLDVVLPGQEKTISRPLTIANIRPGGHTVSLQLVDTANKVVCSYSCTLTPQEVTEQTEFQLVDWATDFEDPWPLKVKFVLLGYEADLFLVNPYGMETFSSRIVEGTTEASLSLGQFPDAGEYTLTVKDTLGAVIATEHFVFQGAGATISEVELTWDSENSSRLRRISFRVSNNGDLPAFIRDCKITVSDGQNTYREEVFALFESVLPGRDKVIDKSVMVYNIEVSGAKSFALELKDYSGKVICSYSSELDS